MGWLSGAMGDTRRLELGRVVRRCCRHTRGIGPGCQRLLETHEKARSWLHGAVGYTRRLGVGQRC